MAPGFIQFRYCLPSSGHWWAGVYRSKLWARGWVHPGLVAHWDKQPIHTLEQLQSSKLACHTWLENCNANSVQECLSKDGNQVHPDCEADVRVPIPPSCPYPITRRSTGGGGGSLHASCTLKGLQKSNSNTFNINSRSYSTKQLQYISYSIYVNRCQNNSIYFTKCSDYCLIISTGSTPWNAVLNLKRKYSAH